LGCEHIGLGWAGKGATRRAAAPAAIAATASGALADLKTFSDSPRRAAAKSHYPWRASNHGHLVPSSFFLSGMSPGWPIFLFRRTSERADAPVRVR
jgi:hypothetical protein